MLTPLAFFTVLTATPIALPAGPPVVMDYLAYDGANQRVWVPAGNTGSVDVIDLATGKVTAVSGFPTAPSTRPGRPNMGPSSATVGDASVWVGNRADKKICGVDRKTLEKRACVQLGSSPDGVVWVATTHEVWVTTPHDQTLTVLDTRGKTPVVAGTVKLEGDPEGYAVDAGRGVFYTNLEDKDKTLAIDVKTRKVVSTWSPGCGGEGPRGLALDEKRRLLFVACSDGAVTLDLAHDGKPLGRLKTGGGVDNIDYLAGKKLLYVASGQDATLTVASVADGGALTLVATAPTGKGARVVVVDDSGTAYVADSLGGRVLSVKPPAGAK